MLASTKSAKPRGIFRLSRRPENGEKGKDIDPHGNPKEGAELDQNDAQQKVTNSETATTATSPRDEKPSDAVAEAPIAPPVSFISMFRYTCSAFPLLNFIVLTCTQIFYQVGAFS
jgi:hypothetical protein